MPGPARPADTSPEIWRMMRAHWRAMTIEERAAQTMSLADDLESLALDGIRATNPRFSEAEVQYELARRRYGRRIADIAFGRVPVS